MKFLENKFLTLLAFQLIGLIGYGQSSAFYIGHSLSDGIGEMVKSMSEQAGNGSFQLGYQSIPGAPLRWQWERKLKNDYNATPPIYFGFYDHVNGLPSKKYAQLVLTESVPRQIQHDWGISETYKFVDSFYQYAIKLNPDVKIYFYEVWHCIKSGTPTGCMYDINSNPWRQRLTDDLPMWESVVTKINEKFKPKNPICLIPVGQALARLNDEILAGRVPGYANISQLFTDDIHLSDAGRYFVACVHYAVLQQKNPVGLSRNLKNIWGGNFTPPSESQAKKMQEIAWETVTKYKGNCLNLPTDTDNQDVENISIFPNPAENKIHVDYIGNNKLIKIYNVQGNILKISTEKEIDISALPNGLIFIDIEGRKLKMIKVSNL